jgi:regulator of sirC expression with transglutaminase-like and TPR domain
LVRFEPAKGEAQLLDVYNGAKPLARAEAKKLVEAFTERPAREEDFAAVSKKAILVRILDNLMGNARSESDLKASLRYLDIILAISPDSAQERLLRAAARFQSGNRAGALEDVEWLLKHRPEGVNEERILEFRRMLKSGR